MEEQRKGKGNEGTKMKPVKPKPSATPGDTPPGPGGTP